MTAGGVHLRGIHRIDWMRYFSTFWRCSYIYHGMYFATENVLWPSALLIPRMILQNIDEVRELLHFFTLHFLQIWASSTSFRWCKRSSFETSSQKECILWSSSITAQYGDVNHRGRRRGGYIAQSQSSEPNIWLCFRRSIQKGFLKYAIAILMGTSILYNELEFGNRRFRARSNLISYGMSAVPRMYLEQAQVLSAECWVLADGDWQKLPGLSRPFMSHFHVIISREGDRNGMVLSKRPGSLNNPWRYCRWCQGVGLGTVTYLIHRSGRPR